MKKGGLDVSRDGFSGLPKEREVTYDNTTNVTGPCTILLLCCTYTMSTIPCNGNLLGHGASGLCVFKSLHGSPGVF